MMSSLGRHNPMVTVTSDVSGRWGCGAFASMGKWLQCEWQGVWEETRITAKELLPVVLACAIWGQQWQGQMISVLAIMQQWSQSSGRNGASIISLCISCEVYVSSLRDTICGYVIAEHVPGEKNQAVDAISRGNLPLFFSVGTSSRERTVACPSRALGAPHGEVAGLDIGGLEQSVHHYFTLDLAPSTQRTYQSGKNWYLQFCQRTGAAPLLAMESVLRAFSSYLASHESLRHYTIKLLSAVSICTYRRHCRIRLM